MGRRNDDLIIGLDIGTTKICVVVGERTDDGLEIVGVGQHKSTGLRKGVVINIEATINAIVQAVEEAELMAGCEITEVFAGIAGSHIKGFNSKGVIAVQEKEVSEEHVRRVIEQAKAVVIPRDQEIIHVVPQDYIIDEQDGIREPRGMAGVRLEVRAHVVTAAISALQNIVKCANRAGLKVSEIVLEPIASAEAVLSEDEKELGVAMVDIGGGTSDLALFVGGSIVHTAVLPLGGNHFTNDIAWGLKTPFDAAEEIKLRHGCALGELVERDETIAVPSTGGRPPRKMERSLLTQIIEARADELIHCIEREILKSGYSDLLAAGLVLTGGSAALPGLPDRAERLMDTQVRRGLPIGVGGLTDIVNTPSYATGVGLMLHAHAVKEGRVGMNVPVTKRGGKGYARIKDRMRAIVAEFF